MDEGVGVDDAAPAATHGADPIRATPGLACTGREATCMVEEGVKETLKRGESTSKACITPFLGKELENTLCDRMHTFTLHMRMLTHPNGGTWRKKRG